MDVIRELVHDGTTLLLMTQYLEEADRLVDEIVVIDRGKVIARGSADARTLTAPVTQGPASLMAALRRLDAEQVEVLDVGLRRPTLDDVFLTLTGRATDGDASGVRYVFGSSIEVPGMNYREFLTAGIFAQTVIFGPRWPAPEWPRTCPRA